MYNLTLTVQKQQPNTNYKWFQKIRSLKSKHCLYSFSLNRGVGAADRTLRQQDCRPSRGFQNDSPTCSLHNYTQSLSAASAGPGETGPRHPQLPSQPPGLQVHFAHHLPSTIKGKATPTHRTGLTLSWCCIADNLLKNVKSWQTVYKILWQEYWRTSVSCTQFGESEECGGGVVV